MGEPDQVPTLVCLIGAPAVGKMTVGQELCRLTGFHLFHGHIVADVLATYFAFGTPPFVRLGQTWRRMFFEEAQEASLNLVTTVAWRFDVPDDAETIWRWLHPYVVGGRVLCVELVAPLEIRLERNHSENRRRHKNASWVTDEYLRESDRVHCYDSGGDFPFGLPYLRLVTEHVTAAGIAQRIAEHFNLPRLESELRYSGDSAQLP